MHIEENLARLESNGLLRELEALPPDAINLSSNDYLGLSQHPQLKEAATQALQQYGTGSGGSRLMCGNTALHEKLENELADFLGYEGTLVFGSGFLANLGVLSTLSDKNTIIFFDKLNHASLIDGVRLSEAKWKSYRHNDAKKLESLLRQNQDIYNDMIVVTDSLFSMNGDVAPLQEIRELCNKYGATLVVDEAHAIGIFGERLNGLAQAVKPDIITGTFSKSFGSYGGFAACSGEIKKLLINKARSFIYSTSLPPSVIAASNAALCIIKNDSTLGPELLQRARFFYDKLAAYGFELLPLESQIIPVIIGDNEKTLSLSETLKQENIYAKAVRPPTVPKNSARLRLSVTLSHSYDTLEQVAEKLKKAAETTGIL